MSYLLLGLAIIAEVIATSALKSAEGFTKIIPSMISIVGYMVAFYLLSIVLKSISVGVAYAIWAGLGIVLIVLVGFFVFNQKLDFPALAGIFLIVTGVVVINVFSNSVAH